MGSDMGVKQFILLSAICVQKPRLAFQKAKLDFEDLLRNSTINHTIIRPTAFFKSLAGQIERVKNGKRYIVFDKGLNNKCKPISERDLAKFICDKVLDPISFNRTFLVGGPGRALSPKEQGELLFKLANQPPKFFHVPSYLFKLLSTITYPFSKFLKSADDFKEFMEIAHYYATESMLVWEQSEKAYNESKTPEFGQDTLETFFKNALKAKASDLKLPDKRLF